MLLNYNIKKNFVFLIISLLLLITNTKISAQLLSPETQPKFVNPLPIPTKIDATNGGTFNMYMAQTTQWLGLVNPVDGTTPLMTTVWGYGTKRNNVTYPGPTFLATENTPVFTNWYNNLPGHFLPVDPSFHMAAPMHKDGTHFSMSEVAAWYAAGNVPTVAHLHGGHTESASDGLPEQWFTQREKEVGNTFVKTNYVYDNSQEAATLWYHDHALGITRLNVYAGLAGFYLLNDLRERNLVKDGTLPARKHDFEIVIQDRCFYENGELFWPANPNEPSVFFDHGGTEPDEWNAWEDFIAGGAADNELFQQYFPNGGPTGLAEFFGNFIVVNGTIWPYLDVEPRPYRFRLLNGSDSRFYVLRFEGGQSFLQIATDDGLLPNALTLDELIIAPGERAEIVVDFATVGGEGNSIKLLNFGPDEPYGGGEPVNDFDPADPSTTGQIMQFNVNKKLVVTRNLPSARVVEGTTLRPALADLGPSAVTRKLALFEGMDEFGRLQPMLGAIVDPDDAELGTTIESLTWEEVLTEKPVLNEVETWEVYNFTGDAHPVHLHLVSFQIEGRVPIEFDEEEDFGSKDQPQHGDRGTGQGATIDWTIVTEGTLEDPADNERGWKDTFIVPPGMKGIVKAKFDRLGRYVWHCHILSHEDHEMMRPFEVVASLGKQNGGVVAGVSDYNLEQNYPNPFNPSTTINFSVPEENTFVSLKIYNSLGQEVGTLINQIVPSGNHEVQFDASALSSGVYFYTLKAGNFVDSKKMTLMK